MDAIAMHISNGMINGPISALFAGLAIATVVICVAKARRELDERLVPLAGLVAAFIFAIQMINFPVLPGVSGHVLGGALAALLVGPWVGALCLTVVIVVQALLFSDGGVTALGLNVINMAVLGTAVGYLVAVGLIRLRVPLTAAAVLAGVFSIGVAAQGFVVEFALGGPRVGESSSIGLIALGMGVPHLLIGIVDGLITAVTVNAVARARPDLVYALRTTRRATAEAAETTKAAEVQS